MLKKLKRAFRSTNVGQFFISWITKLGRLIYFTICKRFNLLFTKFLQFVKVFTICKKSLKLITNCRKKKFNFFFQFVIYFIYFYNPYKNIYYKFEIFYFQILLSSIFLLFFGDILSGLPHYSFPHKLTQSLPVLGMKLLKGLKMVL